MLAKGRKQGIVSAKRKRFYARAIWELTKLEIVLFEAIKGYLSNPRFLTH
jgi:hypothetical protein